MARYTDEMTARCFEIEPEDENYIEELINQAGMFRDFGTALDTYMEDLWRSVIRQMTVSGKMTAAPHCHSESHVHGMNRA